MYINRDEIFTLGDEYEYGCVVMKAITDVNLKIAFDEMLKLNRGKLHFQMLSEYMADYLELKGFAKRIVVKDFVCK